MISNKLVLNKGDDTVYRELVSSLNTCKRFYFNVAFVSFSGLQLLLEELSKTEARSVPGKVVTSTYLNFTDPYAVRRLSTFSNIDVKMFIAKKNLGFHPKAYIFEYEGHFKVIIGSANLTQSALKSNIEWNVSTISKSNNLFLMNVMNEFDQIWEQSNNVTEELLIKYQVFLDKLKNKEKYETQFFENRDEITPNSMQEEAIDSLTRLRIHGESKALVIAATGSGKTYMSAFDVANANPRKLLFVVHREDILKSAMESFKRITKLHHDKKFGYLSGTIKELDSDFLFSTNISLANNLDNFQPNHFDYIIIDEAHHVSGDTYQRILSHFTPQFLLGMTSTPERGDAQDIYTTFDNNIAVEIRLRDALNDDLIVPFHYFGITDAESVDYENVNMHKIDDVARILQTHSRVDHILKHLNFYGYEGKKRRCIGFCITIKHAKFMAEEFQKNGVPSLYLSGEHSQMERKSAIERLQSETDTLEVIFTIDIFNEGVDIPSVNTILMLRPTESPVVFIQQLGRGLRKHNSKSFVTVLDFIGNYSKSFLMAIALNGRKFYDKDSLKVAVQTDFANLPGCTHIQLDEIAKHQILNQIEGENFNSLKYLKEEYESFKLLIGNKAPKMLDYFSVDGAPDPIKFIKYSKTYLNFLSKVEGKSYPQIDLLAEDIFVKFLRLIEDFLPAKRLVDFVAFKLIIQQGDFILDELKSAMLVYIESVSDETIIHCTKLLSRDFFDSTDLKKYAYLGRFNADTDMFEVDSRIKKILLNEGMQSILLDSVLYGIHRYENEFGSTVLKTPDLGLYQQYNMRDVALVSNYSKKHSAFRGQGLITIGSDYFLFIELHKHEEAIAYRDKFISETRFQWDSPTGSHQDAGQGHNVIHHKELGINLHLFVRKFKQIDGVVQPYVYIGKGETVSYEGNRPILFQMQLKSRVPLEIYREFITKSL